MGMGWKSRKGPFKREESRRRRSTPKPTPNRPEGASRKARKCAHSRPPKGTFHAAAPSLIVQQSPPLLLPLLSSLIQVAMRELQMGSDDSEPRFALLSCIACRKARRTGSSRTAEDGRLSIQLGMSRRLFDALPTPHPRQKERRLNFAVLQACLEGSLKSQNLSQTRTHCSRRSGPEDGGGDCETPSCGSNTLDSLLPHPLPSSFLSLLHCLYVPAQHCSHPHGVRRMFASEVTGGGEERGWLESIGKDGPLTS